MSEKAYVFGRNGKDKIPRIANESHNFIADQEE